VVEWCVVGVLWMVEVILVINIVSKSGGWWCGRVVGGGCVVDGGGHIGYQYSQQEWWFMGSLW
jgi:hypothetical protein